MLIFNSVILNIWHYQVISHRRNIAPFSFVKIWLIFLAARYGIVLFLGCIALRYFSFFIIKILHVHINLDVLSCYMNVNIHLLICIGVDKNAHVGARSISIYLFLTIPISNVVFLIVRILPSIFIITIESMSKNIFDMNHYSLLHCFAVFIPAEAWAALLNISNTRWNRVYHDNALENIL